MELKLLRDKYIAYPDGSDSCHVAGDIIDADPERAEVWIRRGQANHLRHQIRDYVAGTLLGSLTTTGSRVHQTPIYPLATESLPGLAIFVETEDVQYVT